MGNSSTVHAYLVHPSVNSIQCTLLISIRKFVWLRPSNRWARPDRWTRRHRTSRAWLPRFPGARHRTAGSGEALLVRLTVPNLGRTPLLVPGSVMNVNASYHRSDRWIPDRRTVRGMQIDHRGDEPVMMAMPPRRHRGVHRSHRPTARAFLPGPARCAPPTAELQSARAATSRRTPPVSLA